MNIRAMIKTYLLLTATLFILSSSHAQNYSIDARIKPTELRWNHLKMGGENFKGEELEINNHYLTINGKPSIPISGEIHFSRYPNANWNEAIQKMKAGGINIIATYVFWNMHEEHEGRFNWEGDFNLRKFIELCAANNIKVILRIGPFCHGEIRNGGLPDWLLGKLLTVRSNDPEYLKYVDRLYKQIGQQVKGLMFKDGGPIMAIQLENEYQHSAAPWGLNYPGQTHDWTSSARDKDITQQGVGVSEKENPYAELGNQHMTVLKSLAQKNGLIAPLYTATGWGNAAIIENETLPVTAAYAYPGWAPAEPSHFYLYTNLQENPDYAPVRYHPKDYPYFAAEIGGGIMNTYTRRPVVPANSLEALINRFLGSGANGIGYYMYHGGVTPKGDEFFFADEAYGYPKMSYDFQAPLSAYGKPVESLNRLKILHFFIQSFEDVLAPMQLVLPVDPSTINLKNEDQLRYALRTNGDEGFLFLNNFQDHLERKDLQNIQFTVQFNNKKLQIPESGSFNLKKDENAILPINIKLGAAQLNYSTAQLLLKGKSGDNEYFVLFAPEGIQPELSLVVAEDQTISGTQCHIDKNDQRVLVSSTTLPFEVNVKSKDQTTRILVIDKSTALNSWKLQDGLNDYLIVSDAMILDKQNHFEMISDGNNIINFKQYPNAIESIKSDRGEISKLSKPTDLMAEYGLELEQVSVDLPVKYMDNKMSIDLSQGLPEGANDVICRINYIGDTGQGFINGKLVIDQFYKGLPWEIGLRDYLKLPNAGDIVFNFRPMYKDAEFLQDIDAAKIPEFDKSNQYLKIEKPDFRVEYKATLNIVR